MKVTKEKLMAMYDLFDRLLKSGDIKNVRFHYLVVKNKKLLETEHTALLEAVKPLEDFIAFERKRLEICQTMAEKDETGSPKKRKSPEGEQFIIDPSKAEEFSKEMNILIQESEGAVKGQRKREEDFSNLLKEEVEVEFQKIKLDIIPDALLGNDVELLFELVEE